MLRAGEWIGPLRIERPLGVGGMAEVYLARDDRLERHVAVKLLLEGRSVQTGARGRMLREARAASALKHPSIVTVHDIGEHDGKSYIVMEYVDGETFSALVERRGALPPAEAVELVSRVATAVAAAHAAGVLHRDLKSQNLMIDRTGDVKVLDFGLSKRTDTDSPSPAPSGPLRLGTDAPTHAPEGADGELSPGSMTRSDDDDDAVDLAQAETAAPASTPPLATAPARRDEPHTLHGARMGTPGWAPPELMNGHPADVRSDVFSLGCVLYHLLAGRPPFSGTSWSGLRLQIEDGPPRPSRFAPGISPALDHVVLGALAAAPRDRPSSVLELVQAARAALGRHRPRRRLLGGIAVAAAALAAVGVLVSRAVAPPARSPADDAPRVAAGDPARDRATVSTAPTTPTRITALGGCAYNPTFLADSTLVFDLTRDNAVDLYRYESTGAPVQLTSDPGWEWRSGRGIGQREVIFLRQNAEVTGIDALDLDSGDRRTIAPEAAAAACTDDACYYAPPNGGSLRRIRQGRDESFASLPPGTSIDSLVVSPDGSRLAMILLVTDTSPSLCVLDIAHPEVRCLDLRTTSARPAFSSDGATLYFEDDGILRVRLVDATTAPVVPGVSVGGGIAVSPSGDAMVYSDCRGRSVLVDAAEDVTRAIVDEPSAFEPAVGASGELAYVRLTVARQQIMLLTPGGPSRELIAGEGMHFADLALSADGARLAYVQGDRERPGIYLTSLRTVGLPNRLTDDATDATPVFVGDQIVFTRRDAEGVPHLMRVDLDGSGVSQASSRARITIGAPADGSRVLVTSPARDFLYWWDPQTDRETRGPKLPGRGPATYVSLSPNGEWLGVIVGPSGQSIWRARVDGTVPLEEIARLPVDQSSMLGAIDDRGHPLVAAFLWSGELWRVPAAAGTPW